MSDNYSSWAWSRIVGGVVAALSAIEKFAFLPYHPVWSIIMIALAIAVIWALTAHGTDLAASKGA